LFDIERPYSRAVKARWTEGDLRRAVADARSIREIIEKLGLIPAGGNYATMKEHFKKLAIDTSHLKGSAWNKGMKVTCNPGRSLEEILKQGVYYKSYKLKLRLFRAGLKFQRCEDCGWAERTKDGYLPLEIHHVNGDPTDNRLENLQILCPNCHSLKPNYRARIRR